MKRSSPKEKKRSWWKSANKSKKKTLLLVLLSKNFCGWYSTDQLFYLVLFFESAPTDGLVHAFDQHEDSVYQVAWSSVDPWLFMSLSYDGRAVMNQVPSEEKFKIIMN